jgi:5-methyltetrahydrofolate--homocysteine methyltransferase
MRIRGELGLAATSGALLPQGYRGSSYSFGYPACPNLADQKQLRALLNADEWMANALRRTSVSFIVRSP